MFNQNQKTQSKPNFAFKNNNLHKLFNSQGSTIFYPEINRTSNYNSSSIGQMYQPNYTIPIPPSTAPTTPTTSRTNISNLPQNKNTKFNDASIQADIVIEEYLDSQGISKNRVLDKIVDYIYMTELKNQLENGFLKDRIRLFVNNYFVKNNITHDFFIMKIKGMITNLSAVGQKVTYNWDRIKGSEISMIAELSNNVYNSYLFTQPKVKPVTPPSLDNYTLFEKASMDGRNVNDVKKENKNSTQCCELESRIIKLEQMVNDLRNEVNELKIKQMRTSELESQLNDISSIINQSSVYSDDSSEEQNVNNNNCNCNYNDLPPLISDDDVPYVVNNCKTSENCNCSEDEDESDEYDEYDNDDIINERDNAHFPETTTDNNTNNTNNTNTTDVNEFDLNKFMNNAEKIGKTIALEFIKSFKLPFNNQ